MTTRARKLALATRVIATLAIITIVVLLLGDRVAFARPGGGQSFSGGGGFSSGSSSGGSGGGAVEIVYLIYYLIRLLFFFPWLSIPLVGGLIAYVIYQVYHQRQNQAEWDSGPPAPLHHETSSDDLRKLDPDFSQVLFEDFAFRLFSTAHRARATADGLATIAPYVSEAARTQLGKRVPDDGQPIEAVIVGAQRLYSVDVPATAVDAKDQPNYVRLGVQYEANVMVGGHTYYSVERWTFVRDARRTSKPPGASKDFPCPNCGAPWQAKDTGSQVCSSCGQVVDNGRFDWTVSNIALDSIDQRSPSLTVEVPERGNDLPTMFAPTVTEDWAELQKADPALTPDLLGARMLLIYDTLNQAWSNNALEPARGFVSDGMFDYLEYWVKAYVAQHLRNELVDMHMTDTIDIAKVVRDKYYDAVTVRVYGSGKDLVVNTDTGKLLRGSRSRERAYTEYWTVIRSAKRVGAPVTAAVCSNCGAPLAISMAGNCEHCGAHVTAGEFDWVLSKIEQDDTYRA